MACSFSGLTCCSTLHPPPLQVTLIDRNERFVFKPLLYELLNGGAQAEEVAPPFRQLLAPYSITFLQAGVCPAKCCAEPCKSVFTGVGYNTPGTHCCPVRIIFCRLGSLPSGCLPQSHHLKLQPRGRPFLNDAPFAVTFAAHGSLPAGLQGAVSSVETGTATLQDGSAGGGQVKLADGQVVEYDWLVLALGSETSTFGIEGVKELAVPFCSFEDAMKVGSCPCGALSSLLRPDGDSTPIVPRWQSCQREGPIFDRHAGASRPLP